LKPCDSISVTSSDNIVASFELRDRIHAANVPSINEWKACSVDEAYALLGVLGRKLELINLTLDSNKVNA
jgi:hypothetical protein